MRILAISGSLRRASHNTALLRAAADLLPPDAELELWDGLRAIPPYDADVDLAAGPAAVAALREAIAGADAILIATPEYNHSIPGQLKNAIDWASRPRIASAWQDKPVGVIGASTGMFGAVWAQAEVRKAVAAAGARVLEHELPLGRASDGFDANGRLVDADLEAALAGILADLHEAAVAHRAATVA